MLGSSSSRRCSFFFFLSSFPLTKNDQPRKSSQQKTQKQQQQASRAASSSTAAPRPASLLVEAKVSIRFQRFGRKKAPFYRLVAIDARDRREGRPLERLGFYDPLRKETNLNAPAIKKWLAVGAQPTETVANLLKKAMVLEE